MDAWNCVQRAALAEDAHGSVVVEATPEPVEYYYWSVDACLGQLALAEL